MKTIRHIITRTLWTIVILYVSVLVVLQLPFMQTFLAHEVSGLLANKLGTRVSIERVYLGLFNRVVVDSLHVDDQQGRSMLCASRAAATLSLYELAQGQVSISSAQLFGLDAHFYKATAEAKPNYQFALDSLASKDKSKPSKLNLSIQSLVVRQGSIAFHQFNAPVTPGKLNMKHLDVTKLSMHVTLRQLTNDTLNVSLRRLAFYERSGVDVRALSFLLRAGHHGVTLSKLHLRMGQTQVVVPYVKVNGHAKKLMPDVHTLRFGAYVDAPNIVPADFAFLMPQLRHFKQPFSAFVRANGTGSMVNVQALKLQSSDGKLRLVAAGNVRRGKHGVAWQARRVALSMSHAFVRQCAAQMQLSGKTMPPVLLRLGDVRLMAQGQGSGKQAKLRANIHTEAGDASIKADIRYPLLSVALATEQLNLRKISDNEHFGSLQAWLEVKGVVPHKLGKGLELLRQLSVSAKGRVGRFDFNNYVYTNMTIDAALQKGLLSGLFAINDKGGKLLLDGKLDVSKTLPRITATATATDFNPHVLRLTDALGNNSLSFHADANLSGNNLKNLSGTASIHSFVMKGSAGSHSLSSVQVATGQKNGEQYLDVLSDYADIHLKGRYDLATLPQSLTSALHKRLPTLPILPQQHRRVADWYRLDATLHSGEWTHSILHLPINLTGDVGLQAMVDERRNVTDVHLDMPDFTWAGAKFSHAALDITTPNDTLHAVARLTRTPEGGQPFAVTLTANAAGNVLRSSLAWEAHAKPRFHGLVYANTTFLRTPQGSTGFHMQLSPLSSLAVGDTIWQVSAADLMFNGHKIQAHNFEISHGQQHITMNGAATDSPADTLRMDLHDIDVAYILNLVNFHSVKFGGRVSGVATVSQPFNQHIDAKANVEVHHFTFQDGRLGTLKAKVGYEAPQQRLVVKAIADDGPDSQTDIGGYFSFKENAIYLPMVLRGSNLEFLHSFCGAFMDNIHCKGYGNLCLRGPLSMLNLEGLVRATGSFSIIPTGTTYSMSNSLVRFIPNEIQFLTDTVRDRDGNMGVLTGALYHENLRRLSYNMNLNAHRLLSYDKHNFDDNSFFGSIWCTGHVRIHGKPGVMNMDVEATPDPGSFLEYNVNDVSGLDDANFITWHDVTPRNDLDADTTSVELGNADIPSDMHLNFLVHANPNLNIRLLMDPVSGDMISLQGNGTINASYFNKGAFKMFGNYQVEQGTYRLTVQNIIKREFQFVPPSSVTFGGDPFQAQLDLKAQYTLNAVPLSDLQLGRSFAQNNVRVNCIMDILGTPLKPVVNFDLALPTMSAETQQMVRSVINTEQDLNQQVLYLLAIGRFYQPSVNNASQEETGRLNKTQLAMQSVLSGTLSQQLNNVLSTVINNSNWNFGANIATGDEGWSNAEYEGLLSGKMLSGRLLLNGQFGYRNNVETNNSSFIGDFDLRYLLFPNGNLAVRVYNQTNDRYFTRNSLTTQGFGLIMKKDFNSLRDLFGTRKKSKKKNKKSKERTQR